MEQKKHPIRRIVLIVLAVLLVIVGSYVAYVFIDYHRIPDMQSLETVHRADASAAVQPGETYTAVAYNIGFGAYTPDFSFFMDGGQYSWAFSKDMVEQNTHGAGQTVLDRQPDFALFEEVDINSTRSYHVDQKSMLDAYFPTYDTSFALNFDSPFLFYPFTQPHGKSVSGLAMYSRFPVAGSLRRSLPITTNVTKLVDLDRCYMVNRIPMSDGRELILYTVHMTAYSSDHSVRDAQLLMLMADMTAEYEAGNAVICGGDFNMEMFSTVLDESTPDWAHPMDRSELGIFINAWDAISEDQRAAQVGTCRDTGDVYKPGVTPIYSLDTFVVSPNVTVEDMICLDTGFLYSDHNPVMLTFHIQ